MESLIFVIQWVAIAFLGLMLFLALFEPPIPYRLTPAGWSALPFIARNPANGCMIVIGSIATSGDGFPGGKTFDVLYQFGVLLAADQMAHDVLPELPVASADDLARWRAVS